MYEKTLQKQYLAPKPVQKKRNRRALLALIVSVLLLVATVFVSYVALTGNNPVSKDSGVTACQKLADNTSKPEAEKKPVGLEDFQKSKHTDLKVAGTDFVTTVKGDTGENAIATLTKMHTQYSILQTACANHGVNLPALPA